MKSDGLNSTFACSSHNAGAMMDVLLPLQRLTARMVSVLVLDHPTKGDPLIGQDARGNGQRTQRPNSKGGVGRWV
jgi:hypothetical protein